MTGARIRSGFEEADNPVYAARPRIVPCPPEKAYAERGPYQHT